jgi:PAT family beta-lactamase induction signal transducer AmpG
LYVIAVWDWQATFLLLALLLLLLTIPVLRFQEPAVIVHAAHERLSYVGIFTSFFDRPGLKGWLIVLVTYKAGESLGSAMVKPMLIDMGLDLKQIGLMVSLVGSAATLLGALLGGWLTTRLGRYRAIIGFGVLQALGIAAYATLSWRHDQGLAVDLDLIYAINAFEHFVSGMAMTALLTAVMDLSRPHHAASDFTVQVSVLAIFGGSFYLAAGFVAESLGYTGYFLLSGFIAMILLLPAAVYCRRLPLLMSAPQVG